MSDAPASTPTEPLATRPIRWNAHASIRRREAADGVFADFAILHQGTFAEMVAFFARLSETDRAGLVIEKAGDRQFSPSEVIALSRRSDFPLRAA